LTGTITQAHIHAPAAPGSNAGVAVGNTSLPSFALGVTSGTYNQTINLADQSVYGVAFFTNNGGTVPLVSSAFMNAMKNGQSYFNIHTSAFGGGEIRANLTVVPEPSTMALLGVVGLAFAMRRRWKTKK
jgi:hypothetical protein